VRKECIFYLFFARCARNSFFFVESVRETLTCYMLHGNHRTLASAKVASASKLSALIQGTRGRGCYIDELDRCTVGVNNSSRLLKEDGSINWVIGGTVLRGRTTCNGTKDGRCCRRRELQAQLFEAYSTT